MPGNDLTDIQKLIHLAARMTDDDVERIRQEILEVSRRAFEEEMSIQAKSLGCDGNIGRLTAGPELTELNNQALKDAKSVVNTYNRDLTSAIKSVYAENKYANRNYYAKHLGKWDNERATRKSAQIAQFSEGVGRRNAQAAFAKFNGLMGTAILVPSKAVCPVCVGWLARGQIPLAEAIDESPPYHPNCFPPGQLVTMADSSKKPIEQVQSGDEIAIPGSKSNVKKVFQRQTREVLYRVVVGDQVLLLTGNHPVKTTQGWILAQNLKVGHQVLTYSPHEHGTDGNSHTE